MTWTSTPKIVDVRTRSAFSCGPVMGRNSLTPGHPGVRVRNVPRKSGPKSLCLCCVFFPERCDSQKTGGYRRPKLLAGRGFRQISTLLEKHSLTFWQHKKNYPCHVWALSGKHQLGNRPRLRERCWIFPSETATAFLSLSEKGSSISWVAELQGDNSSECKLSKGLLRSYKIHFGNLPQLQTQNEKTTNLTQKETISSFGNETQK